MVSKPNLLPWLTEIRPSGEKRGIACGPTHDDKLTHCTRPSNSPRFPLERRTNSHSRPGAAGNWQANSVEQGYGWGGAFISVRPGGEGGFYFSG